MFSGTPPETARGNHTITLKVTDGSGETAQDSFILTVLNNDPECDVLNEIEV